MSQVNSRNEEFKKMLDLGVISQEEYDVLVSGKNDVEINKKSKKNYLWLVAVLLLGAVSVGIYFYLKPSAEVAAIDLSKKYVRHQLQNNTMYIDKLFDVQEKINDGTYVFASSVDSELNLLSAQYLRSDFDATILKSYLDLTRELKQAEVNWPKTSSQGKEFWFSYDMANNNNPELKKSNEKLNKLLADVAALKEECRVGSVEDLETMKSDAFSRMRTIFINWSGMNFDPYLFFAPTVERFFFHRNMSPTEVKTLIDSKAELYAASYIPERSSFQMTSCSKDNTTWQFKLDFDFFDDTIQLFRISKKTYSVTFNTAGKMVSLHEVNETNRKTMTPEEHEMFIGPGC